MSIPVSCINPRCLNLDASRTHVKHVDVHTGTCFLVVGVLVVGSADCSVVDMVSKEIRWSPQGALVCCSDVSVFPTSPVNWG